MTTKKYPYTYRNCAERMITEQLLQGLALVQLHAETKGYRLSGDLPGAEALQTGVQAATQTLRKRLLKHVERLHKRTSLQNANQFLHVVCVRLLSYGPEVQAARLDISEKEAAIQVARVDWRKAGAEAEALRLAYVAEKADFYRRSV